MGQDMQDPDPWPAIAPKLVLQCIWTALVIVYSILASIIHSLARIAHKTKTSVPYVWLASIQERVHHSLRHHSPPPLSTVSDAYGDISESDGKVYADYAGAPPYPPSVLESSLQDLLNDVYGNPHSEHGWGGGCSTEATERLRALTLSLCLASPEDYVCVLTSGATAALKLVGEAFPWTSGSTFIHLADNHNSVLGIREIAIQRGAAVGVIRAADVSITESTSAIDSSGQGSEWGSDDALEPMHLFAFPLESNFSGVRYQESLTTAIQQQTAVSCCTTTDESNAAISWYAGSTPLSTLSTSVPPLPLLPKGIKRIKVLLDAAKACGTHPPNLSRHQPDFVALSYYKIFGCPTGLGALLIRRDALPILSKSYFGGGALLASVAEERFHVRRSGAAGLEDGTLPFLSIPVALRGFAWLESVGGIKAVESVAIGVARRLMDRLHTLCHYNGSPVCMLYGEWGKSHSKKKQEGNRENRANSIAGQGPVVTFSVIRPDGGWVGHKEVERLASLEGVMLRTGAMCNPGALREALDLETQAMTRWYDVGHVCWDGTDIIDGVPTGAVRASFGYGSTTKHADAIADVIQRHFLVEAAPPQKASAVLKEPTTLSTLCDRNKNILSIKSMFIYPIKSCAAFRIPSSWPLGSSGGLLLDRHWALVGADGRALTLKRCPALAKIKPVVDFHSGILRISAVGSLEHPLELEIPLPPLSTGMLVHGAQQSKSTSCSEEECPEAIKGSPSLHNPAGDVVHLCARTHLSSTNTFNYNEASTWFQRQLGVYCKLVEYDTSQQDSGDGAGSFANEAQLLVVTEASLDDLQTRSGLSHTTKEKFAARFRPNIILGTGADSSAADLAPYDEERWAALSAAGMTFTVAGPCPRCYMVCMHSEDGRRTGSEPLLSLASRTSTYGKRMCFGLLMNAASASASAGEEEEEGPSSLARYLSTGMPVHAMYQ